jgi:hypothetical protein
MLVKTVAARRVYQLSGHQRWWWGPGRTSWRARCWPGPPRPGLGHGPQKASSVNGPRFAKLISLTPELKQQHAHWGGLGAETKTSASNSPFKKPVAAFVPGRTGSGPWRPCGWLQMDFSIKEGALPTVPTFTSQLALGERLKDLAKPALVDCSIFSVKKAKRVRRTGCPRTPERPRRCQAKCWCHLEQSQDPDLAGLEPRQVWAGSLGRSLTSMQAAGAWA